jgi:ABC-type nitrate/sulfonate/bicarbonate transport system substrate-binding protein
MLFRLLMKFTGKYLGCRHEWGKRATAEKAISMPDPIRGIIFPNTALSMTRSYLKSNRDVAIRFLRAFGEGQYRLRNDKEFSMKALSKYTKTTDPEVLAELYQIYGVRYTGQQIPYVRLEGVEEILKGIDSKEARQARAADFVDNSLLKEVEQSGFFRKLYR